MSLLHRFLATGAPAQTYVDDVFVSYTRTGTGASATVTTGINLSAKGGLVWTKSRSGATDHKFTDTVRGVQNALVSNTTAAQTTDTNGLTAFGTTGHTIGSDSTYNTNGATYVDWVFAKAPKFFDVVTYTGNSGTKTVNHNLGSTPGCIITKRTDSTSDWIVWHRTQTDQGVLNSTSAFNRSSRIGTVTSTSFNAIDAADTNVNGATYVAYLFAHDTSAIGLIQCGSYTGTSIAGVNVTLNFEPQFVMVKRATGGTGSWYMMDSMRGMSVTDDSYLAAESSAAESTFGGAALSPTATGFRIDSTGAGLNASGSTYIYLAIRRPNKPPTLGTQVYNAIARTPTGATYTANVGFVVDLVIQQQRIVANTVDQANVFDRLRGATKQLATAQAQAEATQSGITAFDSNTGYTAAYGSWSGMNWTSGNDEVYWNFKRAPGVFDEVCYTGDGGFSPVYHSLGVEPQWIIAKRRDGVANWVGALLQTAGTNAPVFRGGFNGQVSDIGGGWTNVTGASKNFFYPGELRDGGNIISGNTTNATYVAYLFATSPGISKVGSYTGNGSSQTINAGFTTGARFILIKRTDSTGDWYVWDSTRGIVAGNDPHLSLNTTAAEVTTDDSVDTNTSGFIVNQLAATDINVNAATYIYLSFA